MGRKPCCEKVGLKKGRWTTEEDEILVNYIKANGEGSWRSLPKNAGLLRCGKSCRLRWINYLRADLKRGNISEDEEQTIIKLHASLGNRWSLIAAHLPGRTDNEIKNYWNSYLSRRIHSFRKADGDEAVIVDLGKIVGIPCKRRRGRTSRCTMTKKKSTLGPETKDGHAQGQGGVPPPPNSRQSEAKGRGGVGAMKATGDPPCGAPVAGPAEEAQSGSMWAHEEPLGSDQLFDPDQLQLPSELWEATKAMASELFGPDNEMGSEFWASREQSGGWGSTMEGESGGWSAVSSLSEERGEGGASMCASSSTSEDAEEREAAGPTPASIKERDRQGGAAEGMEAASATEHAHAEVNECDSTLTVERWTDMELKEMAAKLWDETGEAWPWQWEAADLPRQSMDCCVYEEVALDSWFLPESP